MEHYEFLKRLTKNLRPRIALDIGTNNGQSLNSMIGAIQVIGFEISHLYNDIVEVPKNGELRIQDLLQDSSNVNWDNVDFIFLDIDPHDGVQEPKFIKLFEEKLPRDRSTIVLFDDISLSAGMQRFWMDMKANPSWITWELTLSGREFGMGIYL